MHLRGCFDLVFISSVLYVGMAGQLASLFRNRLVFV